MNSSLIVVLNFIIIIIIVTILFFFFKLLFFQSCCGCAVSSIGNWKKASLPHGRILPKSSRVCYTGTVRLRWAFRVMPKFVTKRFRVSFPLVLGSTLDYCLLCALVYYIYVYIYSSTYYQPAASWYGMIIVVAAAVSRVDRNFSLTASRDNGNSHEKGITCPLRHCCFRLPNSNQPTYLPTYLSCSLVCMLC